MEVPIQMNEYQVDLYDFCSNEVKDALKTFCHRVNHSDADVLIIMAHKAVLLFYLLLAQGHISKQIAKKVIISNLALDFDCCYLEGKKIAILDDIMISGTSIASTINKLLSVGVRQDDIDVIAIAIDQDYFNMNFENTKGISILHCDFKPKDEPCIELSAVVSKVFSYFGIPYDVDFPVYERIPINEKALSTLHSSLFWSVVDVSNGNQRSGGIDVYTLFPAQSVLTRLWTAIGVNLDCCADIKLRLYIKRYPDGYRECCVVPMCLFKEISLDALSTLYDLLKPTDHPIFITKEEPWKAQMRYLEFCIAHQLYAIFSEITSLGHGVLFYENIAKQLFGPVDGEIVYRHLSASCSGSGDSLPLVIRCAEVDHSSIIEEYKKSEIYKTIREKSANWCFGSEYQKGCWINQFMFTSFLWWYDTKEILVRNQLKEQALHYVKDYKIIRTYLYRLKNGLPMSTLRLMLQTLVQNIPDRDAENTISAFIDRAIDEGVIVPTIYFNEDKKYICRAFRHGEDLPFGAADQYRLVYFLNSVGNYLRKAEGNPNPAVAEISLEKMIVLFYQMGLRQGNIFNRFLGFDETEIIHSFLSVHGAIQGYTKPDVVPHIYSERDSEGNRYITWLTSWLYEVGLIEKKPDDADTTESTQPIPIKLDETKRYLEENKRSAASDIVLGRIDSIAELITTWYNGMTGKNKKVFRDNITALTSCANRFVYVSAIATEIHYFNNFWNNQAQYALKEKRDSHRLVARLTDSKDNRHHTANTVQGLYSGREKIQWRHTNEAPRVIAEVAKDFLGSTSASVWTQLWSGVDTKPDHGADDLNYYTNMAEGFLYFFSACFECLKSTDFWDSGTLPQDYDSYKKSYLELARRTSQLEPSLFNALEDVAKLDGLDLGKKRMELQKLVREALFSSEKCVEEIETLVRDEDPTYTVTYKSALILDIAALDPRQIDHALMRFWEQLPEEADKTELNLIRFPRDEKDTSSFFKYGIFFGQNVSQPLDVQLSPGKNESLRRGEFLYDAFETICHLLNGRLCQIRGIFLPHIILSSAFKHNLQRNIEQNAKKFYQNIVKPLESCYNSKWKMQMVLGLDRHVDQRVPQFFHMWKTNILDHVISGAEWVTNCVVCKKDHVRINANPSLMDRVAYSQLKVGCGKHKGLGLLIRLSDRVVCLSCNHIFIDTSAENRPSAISAYLPDVEFDLRPLTEIRPYQSDHSVLQAEDEIILLEPCWNGNIPFDVSMLVSLEDWADAVVDAKCKCHGCNDKNQMKWISSIHVGGAISKGYYQIDGDSDKDLIEIQNGFSGGTYVRIDSQTGSQIIGIHEGRFDEQKRVRMIPRAPVLTAIAALSERSENNGKST